MFKNSSKQIHSEVKLAKVKKTIQSNKINFRISLAAIIGCHLLASVVSFADANPKYCVGIRGNGENVAAHWAGLARMVEEAGMPAGAAGGSSATVSLFLLESVAANPEILKDIKSNPELAKRKQALLLKSIPAYVSQLTTDDKIAGMWEFLQNIAAEKQEVVDAKAKKEKERLEKLYDADITTASNVKDPNEGKSASSMMEKYKSIQDTAKGFIGAMVAAGKNYKEISEKFSRYQYMLNPELFGGLALDIKNPGSFKVANFYRKKIMDALGVFGAFDAESDKELFIRPGIVDFRFSLELLGISMPEIRMRQLKKV